MLRSEDVPVRVVVVVRRAVGDDVVDAFGAAAGLRSRCALDGVEVDAGPIGWIGTDRGRQQANAGHARQPRLVGRPEPPAVRSTFQRSRGIPNCSDHSGRLVG
jgi:hypothetical protein